MNINKPKTEDLLKLLSETGQAREMWKEGFLAVVKRLLLKDPLRYRSFGPYWWLVKEAFVSQEEFCFGETINADWVEQLAYEDDVMGLVAAFAYQDAQVDRGTMHDTQHVIETDEDPLTFFANDEDIERMVL